MSDFNRLASGGAQADDDSFFQPNYTVKRRRGLTVLLYVLVALVVLLAILAVVAELVARPIAEKAIQSEIEKSLPESSSGHVGVKINGFSVILQAISGKLDDVTLTSDHLVVDKIPIGGHIDVTRVPLKVGGTTGPVTGKLSFDQAALNAFLKSSGTLGTLTLGSNTLVYDRSLTFIGIPVGVHVTAAPAVSQGGKALALNPTAASITSGSINVGTDALLPLIKQQTSDVCIASLVPQGLTVTKIAVTPTRATISLHAPSLPLSKSGLEQKGTC